MLKTKSRETVGLEQIQQALASVCRAPGICNRGSQFLLPYDLTQWVSHCALGKQGSDRGTRRGLSEGCKSQTTRCRPKRVACMTRSFARSARLHRKRPSLLFATANCISCRSTGSERYPAAMSRKPERSSIHLPQPAFTC